MKTVNDYMNAPDILAMPEYLREIHAIRRVIQDETRGMTTEQKSRYLRRQTDEMFASFGITPKYADLSGQGKLTARPYQKTALG